MMALSACLKWRYCPCSWVACRRSCNVKAVLRWLIERIYSLTRLFKVGQQRAGEIGISFLVVFSNIFVANNTVAIILSGDMAREVAKIRCRSQAFCGTDGYFLCVVQGLIPMAHSYYWPVLLQNLTG